MTRNPAEAAGKYIYALGNSSNLEQKGAMLTALRRLVPIVADEKRSVALASLAIIITSVSGLLGPAVIAHTVDRYIQTRDFNGVLFFSAILLGIYIIGLFSSYFQTKAMGGVGRRVLFKLRNALFSKLHDLPLDFFNQNKSGDLISRINNDTDKLNQFFSQALVQFAGSVFLMIGAAIFLLTLNFRLGAAALMPAVGVLFVTQLLSAWVKKRNLKSLQSLGGMSAEIQESLSNFRVIVAFNRLDYFRRKFNEANEQNFSASVAAGVAANVFMPIYGLSFNLAQVIVLSYGIHLIGAGNLGVGMLIGFLLYVNNFYNPLRQIAAVWSSLQLALAALDRISDVFALESNMPLIAASPAISGVLLEFDGVSFTYPGGKEVLKNCSFALQRGKSYALVGPTGGGKTTTASLMARLYDPADGRVLLDGQDIRSYPPDIRARKVGFILQEPFLFTGSIRDNILYGDGQFRDYSNEQLIELLKERNLDNLLSRFEQGLDTSVAAGGDSISLGQKQLIAFIRAVLRNPELLILDEATANIDTVTEQLLEETLNKLPESTTKVIIAHRLNTIANADEIFFINSGAITPAGSMQQALEMLMHGKREG